MSLNTPVSLEILRAYEAYTAEVRVRNSRVACLLVVVLMPFGVTLDWMVCPDHQAQFAILRLVSSVLAAGVWWRLRRPGLSGFETQLLCMGWWFLPTLFMSVMIAFHEGAGSTYYAGLNLVILAISTVIQATLRESIRAFLSILVLYLAACAANPFLTNVQPDWRMLGNNLYFVVLTAVIVLTGNLYYNRLRFSEFAGRKELEAARDRIVQQQNQIIEQKTEQQTAEQLHQVRAGILHDVRNLLSPVPNYLYLLKRTAESLPEERRAGYLDALVKIERPMIAARAVFDTIERYAHGGPQMSRDCRMHQIVEDAVNLVRARSDEKGVTIRCSVGPEFIVLGVPLDLTLVLKNLLDNALDALEEKSFTTEKPEISIESRVEAGRGFLAVRDNGVGIEAQNIGRVFDRYFTTKPAGKGTGLGLDNCKRTVTAIGGAVSVRSEPGQFTEFTLEFPTHPFATERSSVP